MIDIKTDKNKNQINRLVYQSEPLCLSIDNYEPIRFSYGGYTYSDEYKPAEPNLDFGSYFIRVETEEISDISQLNKIDLNLVQHLENVMILFKYIAGTCFFYAPLSFDKHRKRMIVSGECPRGWTTNYDDLRNSLDANKLRVKISTSSMRPYAHIPRSPLVDLEIMLKQYKGMDENIKYLMRLNYEADMASDTIRCLVYGKVVEMIDAFHPYHGNNDKRIEECYDGLQDIFGTVTIKDLMGLANSRADTRHYAVQKGDVIAHPFLTYEELGQYGPLIDNLAINEVRMRFGLPISAVIE